MQCGKGVFGEGVRIAETLEEDGDTIQSLIHELRGEAENKEKVTGLSLIHI